MTDSRVGLMIVGAQKAGTSSLLRYLAQHPDVCASSKPEMSYFVDEDEYAGGYNKARRFYFAHGKPGDVYVAKLAGLMYEPDAVERLRSHNPDVLAAVLLRNPSDRAFSAYLFARRRGFEDRPTFEQALEADPARHAGSIRHARMCAYLERGLYAPAIARLWEAFGRDRVRVYLTEDLRDDTVGVCRDLFAAAGLDPDFTPTRLERANVAATARWPGVLHAFNGWSRGRAQVRKVLPRGLRHSVKKRLKRALEHPGRTPRLSPETRARLVQYFRPRNDELAAMLGRDLGAWNRIELDEGNAKEDRKDARLDMDPA